MRMRNAIATLSAIAILILPQEAGAQTIMERVRSFFGMEHQLELVVTYVPELIPSTESIYVDMLEPVEKPTVLNEAVLNLEQSSNSHDWATINNWLLSGLPAGTPQVDPSLLLNSLSVDREQFICLATNIYFEARGSTLDDQRAVALVTLNRARHWRWRGAICDVVWERYQFSWTITAGQYRNRVRTAGSWQTSQLVAYEVLRGFVPDITDGATNYYNPSVVRPTWASMAVRSERIGAHRYMTLRTTQNYEPPTAELAALPLNRLYSRSIRGIMRQMRIG